MVRAVIRALKCENCIKLSAKHGENIDLWSMQFGCKNSGPLELYNHSRQRMRTAGNSKSVISFESLLFSKRFPMF